MFEAGKISQKKKEICLGFIMYEENHQKIRNLIAMILLPKKLHKNDESQTAYLRAAVSRVSFESNYFTEGISTYYLQIANPTVLEKPGAFMIWPVYELLFYKNFYLALTEDQVNIRYKTYKTANESDMQEIIDQRLAPG